MGTERARPKRLTHERVYAVVRRIPVGRVATYGQVAGLAGFPGRARQVGYALAALPTGTTVPWHRVVNAQGRVSLDTLTAGGGGIVQQRRLEGEGVRFVGRRIVLTEFGWTPTAAGRLTR